MFESGLGVKNTYLRLGLVLRLESVLGLGLLGLGNSYMCLFRQINDSRTKN